MKFTISKGNDDGLQAFIKTALIDGAELDVNVKELDKSKSWQQIKGIHKLCDLLIPRFTEAYGQKFDLEGVKLALKLHLDYTRPATEGEVLAEAINSKAALKAMGIPTSTTQFESMIESLKKELVKPKSFAKATKDEMMELITKVQDMAANMDWLEVVLTSNDMQSLINSYKNK